MSEYPSVYQAMISRIAREWKVAQSLGKGCSTDLQEIADSYNMWVSTIVLDIVEEMSNIPLYYIESALTNYETLDMDTAMERVRYLLENGCDIRITLK